LPCGATGQRRDRSLPRPTWLPDGRSWVNSSSMSELGIVRIVIIFKIFTAYVRTTSEIHNSFIFQKYFFIK
jgi:hypothetical protein